MSKTSEGILVEFFLCPGQQGDVDVYGLNGRNDLAGDGDLVFRARVGGADGGWQRLTLGGDNSAYEVELDHFDESQSDYFVAQLAPVDDETPITASFQVEELPDGRSRVRRTGGAGEVRREVFESEAEASC